MVSLPADFVAALTAAVEAREGKRKGDEITFTCADSNHEDRHPSARFNVKKLTWTCDPCKAGGGAIALAALLGVPLPESPGLTLADFALAKKLDPAFLRSCGVRDGRNYNSPCVVFPYADADGEVRAERRRLSMSGALRFLWRKGDKPRLYGLPRLHEARDAGYVVIGEGESDALTLWANQIPALGVPGAGTWKSGWREHLDGIDVVYVWREPDQGGDTLIAKVAADVPHVRIIDGPEKDVSALWLVDRDGFAEKMRELMAAAEPASEIRADALTREAREAWTACGTLALDPNLLERIEQAIRERGYAGDVTPAAIAYLAVSSRHGPKPLNVHFLAASATGKTAALSAGMALHPETAFHDIGAGSARALIYDDEADFRHKTVIVAEADSIPDEGPAASAIRELAESNQMRYAVVERDEDTGKFHTRHIRKDGPTGLITTSTRPLEEQMQTRMLTVAINDSPDQTRLILAAQARAVAGEALPSPDLADFHALQTWLELAGVGEYVIPFAVALSEGIPAEFVRVRRDFPQLLAMIGAIATLYQCQRERDAHGRIVATLEDYSQARRLLINVFTETVTGGVSQAVRETATAVADLYDGETAVDMAALVEALKLHRATAWRRVRTALRLGYLVNEETRRGQPAKLRPGAALPEDRPALPEVDEIGECLNHPETDATVQPNGDGPIWPVSSEPVASPVQRGATAQHAAVASVVQPGIRADLDTKPAINGSAVARLHAKPEGIATPLCIVCGSPDVDGYAVDGTPGCYSHHVKETDSPLVAQAVGLGARIASRTAVTA